MSKIYFIDERENPDLIREIKDEQSALFNLLEGADAVPEVAPKSVRSDSGVYRAIRKVTTRFSSAILPVVRKH